MPKRRHLIVPEEFLSSERFVSNSGGSGGGEALPERNREAHANALLEQMRFVVNASQEIAAIRQEAGIEREGGLYLAFKGTQGFGLPIESLGDERAKIELLSVRNTDEGQLATVFVPANKLSTIERKVTQYRDVEVEEGKNPKNARLVTNLEAVSLAKVNEIWTDAPEVFPTEPDEPFWAELWLRCGDELESSEEVAHVLQVLGLELGQGQIVFPERRIVPVKGSRRQFGRAMLMLNSIAELRRVKDTASFFHEEGAESQQDWIDSLVERATAPDPANAPRVCLLDTGVNDHPLLAPLIAPGGRLKVHPDWDAGDQDGHGTSMAGICMFGDLSDALQTAGPFEINHLLESVKVLRYDGDNQGVLPGDITREAVARAEQVTPDVTRSFVMALSSTDDRDRGKPSTWSAMVDKLASGADDDTKRLLVVSGGNVPRAEWANYPASNITESIHDPGQAWNALTVGAFTEKDTLDAATYPGWSVVAPVGDLGPASSTSATWAAWPVKPDVVMEGGNAAHDPAGSVDTVPSLDVLTTHHQFHARPLQLFGDTSAAAAMAGRFAGQLQAAYPSLWPETVRGLMVHSADWTQAMLDRFVAGDPWAANKRDVRNLVRHCGYGVPSMDVALWSVENALTLVCQGELQPFDQKLDANGRVDGYMTKDMNLHELPWPVDALAELEGTEVELRVTLSYFVEPNPASRGWAGRYRYQSHGLRFAVKKGEEDLARFRHRVNAFAREQEDGERGTDSVGWLVGENTRSLGSIHTDRWRGTARALSERGVIAVYPTIGWWRERPKHGRWGSRARYALLVSVIAPEVEVDLLTTVANQIATQVQVQV